MTFIGYSCTVVGQSINNFYLKSNLPKFFLLLAVFLLGYFFDERQNVMAMSTVQTSKKVSICVGSCPYKIQQGLFSTFCQVKDSKSSRSFFF